VLASRATSRSSSLQRVSISHSGQGGQGGRATPVNQPPHVRVGGMHFLDGGASKSRSMHRRSEPPGSQQRCSSPDTYRWDRQFPRFISSQLTAKQHLRSFRTWQAAASDRGLSTAFSRMTRDSRSAWLHRSSRVDKEGSGSVGGRDRRGDGRDPAGAESKMIMERLLLSPDQVAESLGVCRSRVYDLMRTRRASQRQD
jgi:hypothetical protein